MRKTSKDQKPIHMKYPNHVDMMAKGGVVRQKFGLGGAVSDVLGTNNTYTAQGAPVSSGTDAAQVGAAYSGAQAGLNSQNALTNTLAPQAQQGVNNQNFLQNQYQQMAQGQGPNPAQAALNQNTGTNIAQQAALMAGQRGAGANPGLIAMQAAQQGAATQQQAVGQGATMQAQQQIAAQNNLANLASNQINQAGTAVTGQNTAQQNEQNALLGANNAYNTANVSQQSGLNSVNAGVAAGNQQQNNNVIGGLMGGASSALGAFGLAHGGEVHKYADGGGVAAAPVAVAQGGWGGQYAAAPVSMQGPQMSAAPQVPQTGTNLNQAAGDATDALIDGYKPPGSGGITQFSGEVAGGINDAGSLRPVDTVNPDRMLSYQGGMMKAHEHFHNYFSGGSTGKDVPALVSPKEVYLSPDKVKKVVEEGADPMRIGHHFPGKDKVSGKDSKKNDILPVTLQDGGVVLPLHVTQHKKASERGRAFVEKAVAKHMKNPGKK